MPSPLPANLLFALASPPLQICAGLCVGSLFYGTQFFNEVSFKGNAGGNSKKVRETTRIRGTFVSSCIVRRCQTFIQAGQAMITPASSLLVLVFSFLITPITPIFAHCVLLFWLNFVLVSSWFVFCHFTQTHDSAGAEARGRTSTSMAPPPPAPPRAPATQTRSAVAPSP